MPSSLPERVVLHVGMTKAGSTAIQNALCERGDALLEHGVLFPRAGFQTRTDPFDAERTPGHLPLLRAMAEGCAAELEAECAARGAAAHTLLLSAENVMDLPRQRWLLDLDAPFGERDVWLVAVLRGQDGWLASRYYESVCKGFKHEARSLDRFASDLLRDGAFDHAANLEDTARRFAARRVIALHYDDLDREGRLLGGFLEAVDLPASLCDGVGSRRVNASVFHLEAIEAQRRLNPLAETLSREDGLHWAFDMRGRAATHPGLTAEPPLPSPHVRAAIVEAVAEANAALSDRHFDGRPFGPAPDWPERPAPAPREGPVLDLARHGLRRLAELRRAHPPAAPRRGVKDLPPGAADPLHEEMHRARVVLAYGAAHDAMWLAGWPGRLVTTVIARPARLDRLERGLDAGHPATCIVYPLAEPPAGEAWDGPGLWWRVWDEPFFRHPDLVLVLGPEPRRILAATALRIAHPVRVLATLDADGRGGDAGDASIPGLAPAGGGLARLTLSPATSAPGRSEGSPEPVPASAPSR